MEGAERAPGRLEGVRKVEAIVGGFQVVVTPRPDRTLDLAAIRPELMKVGVRTRRLRLLADGTAEGNRFRIRGWPEAYPLEGFDLPTSEARLRAAVRIENGRPTLRPEQE